MRKTIGFASFVALTATTAIVGANNLVGSDTIKKVTEDVLIACNTLSAGATSNLVYLGTGSGNGQGALANNAQQVAPMSRAINSSGCAGAGVNGEGIVIGLDGISIVAASAVVSACNGAGADDCDKSTDDETGVIYKSQTIPGTSYTLGGGSLGAGNEWKDALRLVYGGADNTAGSSLASRNCNSSVRQALVNTWGNLFENTCSVGGCTQLQHAFRRDEESGTTDVFIASLGLAGNNFVTSAAPFCNTWQSDVNNPTALVCAKDADCPTFKCNTTSLKCEFPQIKPNYTEFQDGDPIRRTCIGTGNLPGPPTGTVGNPPPSEPTEQVCNRDGKLGVVLVINPPPPEAVSSCPVPYPSKDCAKGKFRFGAASARVSTGFPPKPQFERCPNGDVSVLSGNCLVPMALDNDPACINGKNNLPSFKIDTANAIASDGRAYNLITRVGIVANPAAPGNIATIKRPDPTTVAAGGAPLSAELIGSFYRLHTTRTALAAPSTSNTCGSLDNATQQIGCLVAANPCSIGYAGNEAADVAGVDALKVNALEPTDTCVRKLINGGTAVAGTTYPISRKLYLNSMDGFETLPGTTFSAGNDEYAMAKCFANDFLIHSIMKDRGFITIGDITNVLCNQDSDCSSGNCDEVAGQCVPNASPGSVPLAGVFCEPTCGASNCTNNPAGIPTVVEGTRPALP